jgi:hypothetical protein
LSLSSAGGVGDQADPARVDAVFRFFEPSQTGRLAGTADRQEAEDAQGPLRHDARGDELIAFPDP